MLDFRFQRVIPLIANKNDSEPTTETIPPVVESIVGPVNVVHGIESAGRFPDSTLGSPLDRCADELFEPLADGVADANGKVELENPFGTDGAEASIDVAHNLGVSTTASTPWGGSRLLELRTGDVTTPLVDKSDPPVMVLPDSSAGAFDG